MRYTEDSPVALAAAAPGWFVTISSDPDRSYRVVAWATVVQAYTEAGDHAVTTVEPVFVHDGTLYTGSEWRDHMNATDVIKVGVR